MNITNLVWDEDNIQHIARHNVTPEEVEEVCYENKPLIYRGKHSLYYALGRTQAGRYLFIVVRYLGQGRARPVTARNMDKKDRRLYKDKRG